MGAFYPFKPCRACVGDIVSKPVTLSEASVTDKATEAPKDIFPVDTEADPVKVLPAPTEDKGSFLASPVGAVVSVGGVALFVGYLLANMGTTRGSPKFT